MNRISKFIETFFMRDYESFAKQLGFTSWDETPHPST